MKQHKWHKEIKAWADGGEIECLDKTFNGANWQDVSEPMWLDNLEYRIKPQPKEPQYLYVYKNKKGIDLTDRYHGYTMDEYIGKIPLIVESNDD